MTVQAIGSIDELACRVHELIEGREDRVLLGITGPPGASKSSVAAAVVRLAEAADCPAAQVPMDGFHLADVELERLGVLERKGAIDTFDRNGYRALLARVREEADTVIYAPSFDREVEQGIAGAIAVLPTHRLIVTEGNYLLDGDWPEVRQHLTEVWYCDLDAEERRRRLVLRHVQFGKSPVEAQRWVTDVDEANAVRISSSRELADLIINFDAIDARTI